MTSSFDEVSVDITSSLGGYYFVALRDNNLFYAKTYIA